MTSRSDSPNVTILPLLRRLDLFLVKDAWASDYCWSTQVWVIIASVHILVVTLSVQLISSGKKINSICTGRVENHFLLSIIGNCEILELAKYTIALIFVVHHLLSGFACDVRPVFH